MAPRPRRSPCSRRPRWRPAHRSPARPPPSPRPSSCSTRRLSRQRWPRLSHPAQPWWRLRRRLARPRPPRSRPPRCRPPRSRPPHRLQR
ncbi:MAG TPA: triacylglycerol lipase, partial [Propionibacteriaceae bacterium]|nr:triacylglycerol lipase [Propionibacteriaceae bacterium]